VIGYQASTVRPPKTAPSAAAVLPSTRIFPAVASIRRATCRSRFSSRRPCSNPARAAATLSAAAFALLPNTLAIAPSTSGSSISSSRATTPTDAMLRSSLRIRTSPAIGATISSNGTT
jgi:hypothetical protein